jgi:nicotinamidase-related amidase
MGAALLIIDVQNAIDDPVWGRRGQPEMETNIATLLALWRERGDPVIHIRHDSTDPNSPYRPGQPGNGFKTETAPLDHETVIEKRSNSAFIGTDLMMLLEDMGCSELVVTGVLLENSVEATVRMAGNLGFMVFIAEDCVASIDRIDRNGRKWSAEDVHALTLSILDGEYASIVSTTDLMSVPRH